MKNVKDIEIDDILVMLRNATHGLAALKAEIDANETKIDTVDTVVDAIKAKTDNLPSDPADASDIAARFDTVDAYLDVIAHKLTVAELQAITVTGTFEGPGYVNDGLAGTFTYADALNEYIEFDFVETVWIKQWRQYGHGYNAGDGEFKIAYWHEPTRAWKDWKTGIPTTNGAWTAWEEVEAVRTTKIRLICTVLDSEWNVSWIGELEVKY